MFVPAEGHGFCSSRSSCHVRRRLDRRNSVSFPSHPDLWRTVSLGPASTKLPIKEDRFRVGGCLK